MNRVFPPLKADHPLVKDGEPCPLCHKPFLAGQRVMLTPARTPQRGVETVQCFCGHATCCLRGAKTPVGEIDRIKDGDGSPFPVITTDGKQWRLREAGYEE